MDVSQYLEIFLDETKEHLQSLSDSLMSLEQDPENMDTINEIFRAAHTLKGMAGTMGYKRMQNLTHDMENVFSEVRNGTFKANGSMVDILFQCLDALEAYTENIQNTSDEGTDDNDHLIKALNDILANKGMPGDNAKAPEAEKEPEKAKERAPEAVPSGDNAGKEKWRDIPLDDSAQTVIEAALKDGKNVFGITVYIQESCILKAARAFLVFKALEELGETIVSVPSAQDIEDENFEFDFSVIFATDSDLDAVKNAITSVSEIESCLIAPMDKSEFAGGASAGSDEEVAAAPEKEEKAEIVKADKPKETAAAAGAQANTKPDPKKSGKPVVNRTVRVDIEKLDVLMNLVSELIIAKNSLVSATHTGESNGTVSSSNEVNEQIEYLESVTTNLHESVMKVRMVPIESVVQKFPKMIRDLSKKLDKKMQLFMSGEETELDRTVVDEIGDPLMHLLRNSADHGLESAEVRKERGKPEVGSIFLDAYQEGNNVVIEVRDDGNGIDVEAVKRKAIERGTVTAEQAENMSDKDIIDLLFLPSFSTAKQVTDVSGRGVGLDVVRSKIESLSGEVEVKTELGVGSTFVVRLPLTLAIIQALMVIVGNEKYAISLGSIQTIESIRPEDISYVQNKEVINLRGEVIPIIRLDEVLDIPDRKDKSNESMIVCIVKKGDKFAGLVVDELMGQQEIVIKSLGKYINKNKIISGATILGDGEVALIIDANALF
ncbi:MAG TPA: chemotaxis protein CheA [Lachnospiraceae bacterium]|nr:chemotaxis protein CheA [Lachnospiraceae bacterium]